MRSVQNLIELLKSQVALYSDIKNLLTEEKNAVVAWNFTETNRILKEKATLFSKEPLLEEARNTLSERVTSELGAKDNTLLSIIVSNPDNQEKKELIALRDELKAIAEDIKAENTALKMLYTTNINLINDLNAKMGYTPTNKYGFDKNNSASSPLALSALG